jgi:alkanesulfonate monooxygenase SsuD/methylene tetrahydromethanopterin reductase-like flavin-dependent oxidoreductase (luciferase family)
VLTAAADIDEITGGRVVLGLGAGTRRMQEAWYGLKYEAPAKKAAEVIRLLRELWKAPSNRPFSFPGEFYPIAIDLFGRPGRVRDSIPVYLAGVNKLMVRTAGEVADGLVGHPLYSRRYLAERVRPMIAGAQPGGRGGVVVRPGRVRDASISGQSRLKRGAGWILCGTSPTIDPRPARVETERTAIRAAFERFDLAGLGAA